MIRYNFRFTEKRPTSAEAFSEATEAELKVLIALMERGGVASDEELISATGASKSRVLAAVALWQGEGVIEESNAPASEKPETPYGNSITEEFEERVGADELYEQSAIETADGIRNRGLASLMDECAAMMGKPMLSPSEVKRIASLSMQYTLSEEYIAILASHLAERGILTVTRLVTQATGLAAKDINTPEELEAYIADKEREKGDFSELKRFFGIHDRKLSRSEEDYFRKWLYDFGFDTAMISEAYDFTVNNTGKRNFAYMDKLITDWHTAGCKSAAECRERYEQVRAEQNAAAAQKKKSEAPQYRRPEKEKPRYGDFDPMEAFQRALERSFPDEKKD